MPAARVPVASPAAASAAPPAPAARPGLADVEALLARPLLDLVFEAAAVHRAHHDPAAVQCSQLLSIKTGGCPEDCGYCSQSAHARTAVERQPLLDVETVLGQARAARESGADRFC
ncbi:MAG TPA: biotin synthase BioB, partial [Planctomycetota bacterium]|nr:biotin synthase BioB [Planctomycetota bacterium]